MSLSEFLPVVLPLVGLQLILLVIALCDLRGREPERVNGKKIVWVAVVCLLALPGIISYFIFGRRD